MSLSCKLSSEIHNMYLRDLREKQLWNQLLLSTASRWRPSTFPFILSVALQEPQRNVLNEISLYKRLIVFWKKSLQVSSLVFYFVSSVQIKFWASSLIWMFQTEDESFTCYEVTWNNISECITAKIYIIHIWLSEDAVFHCTDTTGMPWDVHCQIKFWLGCLDFLL